MRLRMRHSIRKATGMTFGLLTLVMSYQNCSSDIRVAEGPRKASLIELPTVRLNSNICAPSEESLVFEGKLLFVMDMSLSNIGSRTYDTCAINITNPPLAGWIHYLDKSTAFDLSGSRFSIVDDLSQELGTGSEKRFSVMGFHDSSVFGAGLESCQSELLAAPDVARAMTGFRALQKADVDYQPICTKSPTPPFNLKGTRYQTAMTCLRDKIEYDINLGSDNKKSYYHVIFLTDGQPEDAEGNNFAAQLQSIFTDNHQEMLGMKFYPIYYGPQGGEDQQNAVAQLDPMAKILDPAMSTLVSQDISSLKSRLIQELKTTSRLKYTLKNFHTINLTLLNKQGLLALDENMNGIEDSQESQDDTSQNIRTIFDSFAQSPNEDKDPLPSFLEKIRGLKTGIADYDLDLDRDQVMNGQELQQGRDLTQSDLDHPTPSEYLIHSDAQEKPISNCQNQEPQYNFQLTQIPTLKTNGGFQDPSPQNGIDFSYSAGENLIMFYFVAEPLNSSQPSKKMFMALVRVQANQNTNIILREQDFKEIGEFQ